LGRTGSSALAFLTILLPTYVHSQELWLSLGLAAPIFPMSMCTFILNDINDIERDRVNHPDRPLPSESVSMHSAAVIYVVLFVLSLAAVRMLVPTPAHYVYLGGLLLALNYSTVVNNLPLLKNPYAAATATTPILIVNSGITPSPISWPIWAAVLLFIWGREALMDIQDMAGDGLTWPKVVGRDRTAYLACTLQGAAFLILSISATTLPRLISLAAILTLAAIIALWWRKGSRQSAIALMKAQLVLALVFLI
jgi:geranylgeranylglycerol-phosphate geranylgeranyltransferase